MPGLSYRGLSAWVSIDGKALPIYQAQKEGSTCTAWISSTAGQHFSVSWKDESGERIATSGHVFVDGRDVASAIMRPGRTRPVERTGAKTSSRRIKPFKFSVLELTDDETVADRHDPQLNALGTIKVEITRVVLGAEVPFKGYEAQESGIVHEKAKKMGAHCISYGPSKRMSSTRTVAVSTAPYDEDNPGPFVTFIFKYRSADLLKAQGIIPSANANVKRKQSPGEVIIISDSDDEDQPQSKRQRIDSDDVVQISSPATSLVDVNDVQDSEDAPLESQNEVGMMKFGEPSMLQGSGDDESDKNEDDSELKNSLYKSQDESTISQGASSASVDDVAKHVHEMDTSLPASTIE